jgi:hypothetical protein
MGSEGTPNQEVIIGSIVTAFSHSKIADLVGTDALRSVLTGQYRDLVVEGTLHLQRIWSLLQEQPGFDPKNARGPFCVLKLWEEQMGVEVALPEHLAGIGHSQCLAWSSECPVPKHAKAKALNPAGARAKARASMHAFQQGQPKAPPRKKTRNPPLEIALGVVAIAGLGFGGYTLAGFLSAPKFSDFDTSKITTEIPIASGKKLGAEVNIVVSDGAWFSLPEPERLRMMEATLRGLQSQNIEQFVVLDDSKEIRASAQFVGKPPQIQVRFY